MKTMRAKALASLLAGFVTLAGFSGCHASSAAMFFGIGNHQRFFCSAGQRVIDNTDSANQ